MHYFIQLDDLPHGPLTADQVRLGIVEKRYKLTDLARKEMDIDWKPLTSLSELVLARDGSIRPLPNPMAKASLGLGITAMMLFVIFALTISDESLWFLFPIIFFFVMILPLMAIIIGKVALGKISRSIAKMEGYRHAKLGFQLGVLTILFNIGLSLAIPTFAKVATRGNQTTAISNCRQIISSLKNYAADNGGKYPDAALPNARTSNDVFRILFKSGVTDKEAIFGCPLSSDGNPDGNIGKKPDFSEALKPGENHWAMTKGVTGYDSGAIPLVYEAPADATWLPKWSPDFAGTTKPGRTWSGGRVVIGCHDGSVMAMQLEGSKGEHVGMHKARGGTPIPPITPGQKFEVLDVAR